jgi:hypothetical protein
MGTCRGPRNQGHVDREQQFVDRHAAVAVAIAQAAGGSPIATLVGLAPALIVATTVSVAVSMTFTSPLPLDPNACRSAT